MHESKYTMEEICEATGIPRRTIRYYIQEGLLAPPAGRGRGGFYNDSHLARLNEIRSMQERGMRLAGIARALQGEAEPSEPGNDEHTPRERIVMARYQVSPWLSVEVRRDMEEQEARKVQEIIRFARALLDEGGKRK
jgi:DNA-binding transcriptional MerR regulator